MMEDDGSGGDNWSCKLCKALVKLSQPTNQHPVFTGQMTCLLPNQQCQSTEGKKMEQLNERKEVERSCSRREFLPRLIRRT